MQLDEKLETLNTLAHRTANRMVELHNEATTYKSILHDVMDDIYLMMPEIEDDYDRGYNSALNDVLENMKKRLEDEGI